MWCGGFECDIELKIATSALDHSVHLHARLVLHDGDQWFSFENRVTGESTNKQVSACELSGFQDL